MDTLIDVSGSIPSSEAAADGTDRTEGGLVAFVGGCELVGRQVQNFTRECLRPIAGNGPDVIARCLAAAGSLGGRLLNRCEYGCEGDEECLLATLGVRY